MQLRRRHRTVALVFPSEDVGKIFVVAQCFAIRGLVFLAEMAAARFIASECVGAHEFGEFEEVGNPAGTLKRLIKRFAFAENTNVGPEFFAQLGNPTERFTEAGFIPRHPAFVPKKEAEFAMK